MKINPEKQRLFTEGLDLLKVMCAVNQVIEPKVTSITPEDDRRYHIGTCAFYRPTPPRGEVIIMVPKCAAIGRAGMAWSCPGNTTDRTPYGVLAHELGHHFDQILTLRMGFLVSHQFYNKSREKPISSYLGTDTRQGTFEKEWFAEMFRVFVTNPDLLSHVRPKTYKIFSSNFVKVFEDDWCKRLNSHMAPSRTLAAAQKKVLASGSHSSLE